MPPSKDTIFILLFILIGKLKTNMFDNTGQIGFEFFFTTLDYNHVK